MKNKAELILEAMAAEFDNYKEKSSRTFAVGDIHGAYKALEQCFQRSGFNKDKDRLICLGDVADGWSQVAESIEELMTVEYLIYIIGNHDEWLIDWLKTGKQPIIWTSQGGIASINSLNFNRKFDGNEYVEFFNKGVYYFEDEQNRLYVHGGFDWHRNIDATTKDDLMWDRHLFETACMWQKYANTHEDKPILVKDYKEVFIGHTTTSRYDSTLKPIHVSNVWNLDQGAGWEGKLTIMDVDTKEYWQSDIVSTLYPNEKGRK